ncbi:hypothetical protein KPH14_002536 [Odynerus spinipes]|uniref:Uncharacterized protein n=1 Tax=Odynerus spinipes TaxID=1348599 RepID=A0AAD9VS26_9HYME|nr:hypothetical protein KPH14_002536 [Odynerus spinipes]
MLRYVFIKRTNSQICRYFNTENNNLYKNNKLLDGNIAYETEYYYKKDKELLERLRRKTQIEVKNMQREVNVMRSKIEEYNRDINENLRFLQNLEKNMASSKKKGS